MDKLYVQFGCGASSPKEWVNYDVSPTLRLRKLPILGPIFKKKNTKIFPSGVQFGDIIKGLPVADNSVDGLYSSHTLEHLSLEEFRIALKNSYKMLKPGGVFRMVLPDLEFMARSYINSLDEGTPEAGVKFMGANTLLGMRTRPRGVFKILKHSMSNANHLWMWDHQGMMEELRKVGFTNMRKAQFNDSADPMYKHVEDESRFFAAVAIETIK